IDNAGAATTLISGTASYLVVQLHNGSATLDSFDTDLLTVQNGGGVAMQFGVLEVDSGKLDIGTGGMVVGRGSIDLEANVGTVTTLLENDGILTANFGTLDIDVTSANGRIDLDGSGGLGQVNVGSQGTLDIGAPLADPFSSTMNFGDHSHLVMSAAWSVDVNGDVNVDAGTATATVSGGAWTASGTVNVNSGTFIIEPNFTATSGTVYVGGQGSDATLQLDGTATLSNLQLDGFDVGTANLTVNGNTTISQATLDWDADGASTTTIGATGLLTLNVGAVDLTNNVFDGTINNSGQLNVNLTNPADAWTMAGTLNMNTATGAEINAGNMIVTGTVNLVGGIPAVPAGEFPAGGGAVTFGPSGTGTVSADFVEWRANSLLNVSAGTGRVVGSASFQSGASVIVNNTATLDLEGVTSFLPGSYLFNGGTMNIWGDTSIDASGQNLSLNGGGSTMYRVAPGGTFSLVADSYSPYGGALMIEEGGEAHFDFTGGGEELTLGGVVDMTAGNNPSVLAVSNGSLIIYGTVNLTGTGGAMLMADDITFGESSVVNIGAGVEFSPCPITPLTRINMAGTVNAVADIDPFMIDCGDPIFTGAINVVGNGFGMFMSDNVITLGSTASLDFGAGSEVHFSADNIVHNGETITGQGKVVFEGGTNQWLTDQSIDAAKLLLMDNQVIGDGATLTATGDVELKGGSITGGTGSKIALKGKIVEVKDNTTISVDKIELLDEIELLDKLQVAANKSLQLNADTVNDTNELPGETVLGDGAELGFNLTSGSMTLENLSLESNWSTHSASVNTNGDDLTVTGAINGSGTFHTSGGLVSIPGAVMPRSFPGVVPPVTVNSVEPATNGVVPYDPAGVLVIEGDLELASTSAYEAEIGGTTLGAEHDNITVDGTAMLDGELHVVLFDGFVASPGDTFEVLTYGNHSGEFATLTGDVEFGPEGNDFFQPLYQANRLLLYAPIGGDGNFDGVNDGLDYLAWAGHYGQAGVGFSGGDYNRDGVNDGLDYLIWAGSYGQSTGGLAVAVPEPASAALLVFAVCPYLLRRRTRRTRAVVTQH
ncbi:MAG: hypothetical protein KDA63_08330, partial [Planctomycetales bacterium]|nr:hypothetical protein [Planctomycetales bacterium]